MVLCPDLGDERGLAKEIARPERGERRLLEAFEDPYASVQQEIPVSRTRNTPAINEAGRR